MGFAADGVPNKLPLDTWLGAVEAAEPPNIFVLGCGEVDMLTELAPKILAVVPDVEFVLALKKENKIKTNE